MMSENRKTPTREAIMNRIPRRQFLQQAALAAAVVASDRVVCRRPAGGAHNKPRAGRPLWSALPVQDRRLA